MDGIGRLFGQKISMRESIGWPVVRVKRTQIRLRIVAPDDVPIRLIRNDRAAENASHREGTLHATRLTGL